MENAKPGTAAGRKLLAEDLCWPEPGPDLRATILAIEAEARGAALAEVRRQTGNHLGHDLRQLATDAEKALHCAWPTMFLRVLDEIGWKEDPGD
jgi:hypothetical protein